MASVPTCPLCGSRQSTRYRHSRIRVFWRCLHCSLVFVDRHDYPDPETEKSRYDQHRNSPMDCGYRNFLSALAMPLLSKVDAGAHGLDFGCGPGPALPLILQEAGLVVDVFDSFYAQNPNIWETRYDFITASEVIEHLHNPAMEIERLFQHLVPGGWLGVMTTWVDHINSFERSRYGRDPTHVCFYSEVTFKWIANHWNATVEFPGNDIALFQTKV